MPHGCSRNLYEPQCLLRLCKLSVAIAKKTREHIAKVSVRVNDFQGNHCSVSSVRDPLHIILPMLWLAAKTPELAEWGWGPISNGDTIDTLCERMMDIVDDPTKVLSEDFMMNMFIKYVDALPPFKEYWEHLYENKRMRAVAAESSATVLQFAELRKELFHPK